MTRKASSPRQPLSQRKPGSARAKADLGTARSKTSKTSKGSKGLVPAAPRTARGAAKKGAAKQAGAAKTKTAVAKPRGKRTARAIADLGAHSRDLLARLEALHPDAHCELDHANALQLLVATILSAQCTDKRVNMVTPALFAEFPTAQALADAPIERLEELVKSTGFFRNKAKSVQGMARTLVERHGGEVPGDMESLVRLPGVGRKTANVVLGNAFGLNEGVVVDTHVGRLSTRLGLTTETDPVKVESALMPLFPREKWAQLSHLLIFHGRRVCDAKRPRCGECALAEVCPSAER